MATMVQSVQYGARETWWRFVWFLAVFGSLVAVLALPPASFWFDVERVHVHDAVEGSTPLMDVDRTIKRPFRGHWVATVMRKSGNGFYTFCTANGENDYSPEAQFPDIIDLNWWTWPTRCVLPVGTYQLRTLWTIEPAIFPTKELRITSNVFRITR
ncbi:hypothetical protein [Mesorhizobium sp. Z1-4]|uniref:hypothetical protein n=1 Tax=Mesorhizobium sp. Z1-4 TaxID=2448478 RepID=UPI000FD842C0|nr:hypothetical protein [Mesorhizobium sp. Z1-4]